MYNIIRTFKIIIKQFIPSYLFTSIDFPFIIKTYLQIFDKVDIIKNSIAKKNILDTYSFLLWSF